MNQFELLSGNIPELFEYDHEPYRILYVGAHHK
jgi:hypothetical protein